MEKELLENLVKDGLSSYQIAAKFEVCQTTISYWLKKFSLKTIHKRGITSEIAKKLNKQRKHKTLEDFNWIEIQIFAAQNHTWKEINDKFNTNMNILANAKKAGLFKGRSKEQIRALRIPAKKHTEESKRKLSIAQKNYLNKSGSV